VILDHVEALASAVDKTIASVARTAQQLMSH